MLYLQLQTNLYAFKETEGNPELADMNLSPESPVPLSPPLTPRPSAPLSPAVSTGSLSVEDMCGVDSENIDPCAESDPDTQTVCRDRVQEPHRQPLVTIFEASEDSPDVEEAILETENADPDKNSEPDAIQSQQDVVMSEVETGPETPIVKQSPIRDDATAGGAASDQDDAIIDTKASSPKTPRKDCHMDNIKKAHKAAKVSKRKRRTSLRYNTTIL